MAQQVIGIGTAANDGTGDPLRTAGGKINGNFTELYTAATTVTASTKTANYTLVLADAGTSIEMNVASANTLTVPLNSSVAFPIGTVIEVLQYGAGTTTVAATGGVTLRYTDTLALRKQYASGTLRKRGTDEWIVSGDFT